MTNHRMMIDKRVTPPLLSFTRIILSLICRKYYTGRKPTGNQLRRSRKAKSNGYIDIYSVYNEAEIRYMLFKINTFLHTTGL